MITELLASASTGLFVATVALHYREKARSLKDQLENALYTGQRLAEDSRDSRQQLLVVKRQLQSKEEQNIALETDHTKIAESLFECRKLRDAYKKDAEARINDLEEQLAEMGKKNYHLDAKVRGLQEVVAVNGDMLRKAHSRLDALPQPDTNLTPEQERILKQWGKFKASDFRRLTQKANSTTNRTLLQLTRQGYLEREKRDGKYYYSVKSY
jgi:chromosome segregation ATPase